MKQNISILLLLCLVTFCVVSSLGESSQLTGHQLYGKRTLKGGKTKAPKGGKTKAPKGGGKTKKPKGGDKTKKPKGGKTKAPKGELTAGIPLTASPSIMESSPPSWLVPEFCVVDEDCLSLDYYCSFGGTCCEFNTTCVGGIIESEASQISLMAVIPTIFCGLMITIVMRY